MSDRTEEKRRCVACVITGAILAACVFGIVWVLT